MKKRFIRDTPNIIFSYFVAFLIILIALLLIYNASSAHNNRVEEMDYRAESLSDNIGNVIHSIVKYHYLFGHHSVGENILAGLRGLVKESGENFQIDKLDNTPITDTTNLIDFSPGTNGDPKSKIDGFAKKIRQLHNILKPDVALMKFCFVDFTPDTNVKELMSYYRKQIDALKKEMPTIIFAHITVPLTRRATNIKSKVKRMLGLRVWGDASNISRGKFNALLHKTFPHDPIFDLALIESTAPDGTRTIFTHHGKTYFSLAPEYTNDGGHLNNLGQQKTASELAIFLANISQRKQH